MKKRRKTSKTLKTLKIKSINTSTRPKSSKSFWTKKY